MGGRLNLDGGTLYFDGGTLTLDWGTRPSYNSSTACFWAEKTFQFPISAEKSLLISDKPFESDSKAMKIWVKVAYNCLTLSKNPPFFSKSWLRACLEMAKFIYLHHSKKLPKLFNQYFKPVNSVRNYNTRNASRKNYQLYSIHSNAAKKALPFSGAQI